VADLLASPLAKYITLAANDCGYSGKAEELIVAYVHPLFLKAHSAASKADNPSWCEATRGKFDGEYWKVMKLEIAPLEAIEAWSVIDRFDHRVIASTWAFKCKRYPDGLIKSSKHVFVQEAINNSKELISSTLMPTTPKTLKALEVREDFLVESPSDPKLKPPIDPRIKPMMVQARTKADP